MVFLLRRELRAEISQVDSIVLCLHITVPIVHDRCLGCNGFERRMSRRDSGGNRPDVGPQAGNSIDWIRFSCLLQEIVHPVLKEEGVKMELFTCQPDPLF